MGRANKEYRKIIIIELPDNMDLEIIAKLLSNIHTNEIGCWIRGNDSTIYTSIKWNGKVQRAHRVSFEIFKHRIPDHLFGCHTCDVRACINPEHIFIGNASMNIQDARVKGRIFTPKIEKSKWANFPKLRKLLKGY